MTKLALISPYFPSHGGGIEAACAHLRTGLGNAGYTVTWLAVDDRNTPPSQEGRVIPLHGTDIVYKLFGLPVPFIYPWHWPRVWTEISRVSVCVIVEANFFLSVLAFLFAKLQKKPILLSQHVGKPSVSSGVAQRIAQIAEFCVVRPMLRSADQVVFVSSVVANHFKDVTTRQPAYIIGLGVDFELFRHPDRAHKAHLKQQLDVPNDTPVGCIVGRTTESKGIKTIEKVASLRPDWLFLIAGAGPINPADWKLENVRSFGHLPPDQIAQIMMIADAVIQPSPSESYSLVVREALACGTRVICNRQIVDTDTCLEPYLITLPVYPDEPDATAERFAAALETQPAQPAETALRYLQLNCSWQGVAKEYSNTIEQLVDRSGASQSQTRS